MPLSLGLAPQKFRLGVLLDHFAAIEDPRNVRRIAVMASPVGISFLDHFAALRDPRQAWEGRLPAA
jgi:hypothetical protein